MAGSDESGVIGDGKVLTEFESRMLGCLSRAFHDVGTSAFMEDYIYWKLSLDLDEIVDKPQKFMEGLKTIFGEAGAAVYEYRLVGELQKEFHLVRTPGNDGFTGGRGAGELLQAAITAAWMCP